jgi:hypothetical protein
MSFPSLSTFGTQSNVIDISSSTGIQSNSSKLYNQLNITSKGQLLNDSVYNVFSNNSFPSLPSSTFGTSTQSSSSTVTPKGNVTFINSGNSFPSLPSSSSTFGTSTQSSSSTGTPKGNVTFSDELCIIFF